MPRSARIRHWRSRYKPIFTTRVVRGAVCRHRLQDAELHRGGPCAARLPADAFVLRHRCGRQRQPVRRGARRRDVGRFDVATLRTRNLDCPMLAGVRPGSTCNGPTTPRTVRSCRRRDLACLSTPVASMFSITRTSRRQPIRRARPTGDPVGDARLVVPRPRKARERRVFVAGGFGTSFEGHPLQPSSFRSVGCRGRGVDVGKRRGDHYMVARPGIGRRGACRFSSAGPLSSDHGSRRARLRIRRRKSAGRRM